MRNSIIFLCSFIIIATSCNTNVVYEDTFEISNSVWQKKDIKKFTFEVPDTTHIFDIELQITNTDDYSYSNVFLFSNIIFPNRTYARDTIEFVVSNNKGEWTGSGMNSFTNSYPFKRGIRFPKTGVYTFSFEQAMRCVNKECSLEGIKEISLRIIRK